ncbi:MULTISPECIES: response regulator transcription factor [unclassified Oceanobacter]|uniref:response regulator transcription factor n=1 Tax=unclassified Oceanobacter TaxID=2620260 RepID=UPI0026E40AFD|nr:MULTISPECIES: response regulator [unclassified Oceanobacter]MDO6682021.1 response regulator [Oceanobacter sp. 5_MG-2023]MDP2505434.1 response regulator [Oceanobacter sp. 3_MG-2023]MDP2548057.1 response regulator [Oceanobacter sp. 4_MG-2023]MDP2610089.1 response regulator [Oceanobacter sp. 1_MG-2023]MDP2612336.1 response regulator [Oceanobacter sp. 2_MG-2023]
MTSTQSLPRILVIDDDLHFSQVLCRSLERQGFSARPAHNSNEALAAQTSFQPQWATLDLRMEQESGLTLIPRLLQQQPELTIVMLTGYASIATAVEAIKLGAHNYLHKPVTLQELVAAFKDNNSSHPVDSCSEPAQVMSVDQLEWEHIQRVLNEHDGNVSATARALNMHRRTLQRKLQKYAPR